jgi:tRNA(Arg) A34 adenosine deaminase TadA
LKDKHLHFLRHAIAKAKESVDLGGFPAGTVIVTNDAVIGEGVSIGNVIHDPTSHSDMESIRSACTRLHSVDLSRCVLYASMQPCLMCFAASMWSAIPRIYYAARKEKVSPAYYGGDYNVAPINAQLTAPIELIHIAALEPEALVLVSAWESKQ